ncbi:MAG: alanine--tRNA ligase [Clostridiales bacterium]|jgi:alanyl-tRNA synthetase|nr:alanine--tRNA ligase [Clostridiales bacterium]
MKKLGVNEVREEYLAFFEEREHLRLPSFSLVPDGDKSLLLINAGMAPLKPYFMGSAAPPAKRVATCQKCIRTGDIEEVGKTARHGTFFEMLGNFSFANYFKRETIHWAWEFVTGRLEIPKDKLYITVYLEDDEAEEIWHKEVGVPMDRIYRMGKDENFWELSVGPCGPCSEIYFDRGPEFGQDDFMASVLAGEDRYLEFWNLVFIQFNRVEEDKYEDLPAKGIDTGMGLERMAMIMQGVNSIFDVDTIKAVRDEVCAIAGVKYTSSYKPEDRRDASIRLITDHIRSVVFMMSDGITPGNGEREYVLKRLLRRAARHGRLLGISEPFLARLAQIVIDNSKSAYPVLAEKQDYILKLINLEEERFYETLEDGMAHLQALMQKLESGGTLDGVHAFKLHDTYGFPLELTREILEEQGLKLDEDGFRAEMEAQRARARAAREDAGYTGTGDFGFEGAEYPPTEFVGYKESGCEATVLHVAKQGDEILILLDKTPVYAEAGGQKADFATLKTAGGQAEISGCVKTPNGQFVHIARITNGAISAGDSAKISIDTTRREDITRHHTATHLLHYALGKVLGAGVTQAGASKSPDSLRFDFNHFAPLAKDEIRAIEDEVNRNIWRNLPVYIEEMPMARAKEMGAVALFGEKYGDMVRVVDIGGEWPELCGGTHVAATGEIGAFKIVSEGGIAAGVRRIEAVVGNYALAHYRGVEDRLAEAAGLLKVPVANLLSRIEQLTISNKELNKQLEQLKQKDAQAATGDILNKGEEIGGITLYSATLDGLDMDALRKLSDNLIGQMSCGVLLLAATADGKANILARATKDALAKGVHCGNIVKAAATAAGGGGGGRPDMAQAGLKEAAKLSEALTAAKQSLL